MNNGLNGKPCPECLRGLFAKVWQGCGLADDEHPELRTELVEFIDTKLVEGRSPSYIATRFLKRLRDVSGVDDPFEARKKNDAESVQELAGKFAPLVGSSFRDKVKAAIIGNALDHFAGGDGAAWFRPDDLVMGIDDTDQALEMLKPGAKVAYLADNCGEQFFDVFLTGWLMDHGVEVTYVVKSAPVMNDLSLEAWQKYGPETGLGKVIASGTEQVGLEHDRIPTELEQLLNGSDLVIAKGMGHYETLGLAAAQHGPYEWPLLLLFLAKCDPVANHAGLAKGHGAAQLIRR